MRTFKAYRVAAQWLLPGRASDTLYGLNGRETAVGDSILLRPVSTPSGHSLIGVDPSEATG
jgi:hypothetical protein